ncbi:MULTISPECIES: DUF262 and DUF1524 domain-containing protein [unclassified Coleofasciculus]|uniref:DUF262 and DUF1524 domain-containing protein n=1 Tax=unclassified Coleofasciculus TaxID=2692782 RepID=UPI00187F480E|nr:MULTISPECIES: DUF262 and DUF1524 domain-containing protein [unclassified Coleofasciculus]MBE9128891.1 DUF262 domain-containing protein [Coleofasciculus sp. LEGE 07081]MBE9151602.1 DUF262 domain-containing protein [Coleofasciculus sp. LEGE 07092]
MKATEVNCLKFLQQPNQFVIPIYQRTYSWTLKQCQQLWHDIVRVAEDEEISGHFVGSIVYIEGGLYQVAAVPQLLVIDGQQRLTTLCLLLSALGKAIEASGEKLETNRKKIESYYLFNTQEEGEERYKLLLTQSDRETFIRLIEERELPQLASKQIVENYQYFENQIRKLEIDLNSLYRGISKLIIVNIALERDRDNPQLIFESLNSTGLDLSQADLIRNYVLMGLPPKEQEQIYNNYWYPMEQNFDRGSKSSLFDRFMRDYLTLKSKSGAIPNIRDVYSSFKNYVQKQAGTSIHDIITDVYHYSKHYVKLAFEQETDSKIKQALADINTLKVDVAYPFLLGIYEDYSQNLLMREEFVSILRLVESYVFRRAICGIPTNSMNKTFANFSREIDRENYLESVQLAFVRKDAYKRFPDDEEFRREFLVKDIYSFRNRNYLLRKLENHDRTKELVNPEDYTIEHIMPQNPKLSAQWQADLGESWQEIQGKYLHTIGNLTLTGYNSEYSDRPFWEKRDIKDGFADSPLRLNRMLAKLDGWNETEIKNRAEVLAGWAVKVWAVPAVQIDSQNLNVQQVLHEVFPTPAETYRSRHAEYLQGEVLELFEALRKRILNLDASVREEFKKFYIAYKTTTNFVDIVPQKSRLRLSINMKFDEIDDPKGLCRDVTNVGRWGNGDVEVGFSLLEQLDDVMALVRQAFDKHKEESEA